MSRNYSFGRSRVEVAFGDITLSRSDVLISSDDYMLSAGGGVSAAIASAAGGALRVDAAKCGPLQLGDVVVTSAGAMDSRFVFHIVTIGPHGNLPDESIESILARSVGKCLGLARMMGLQSISFPAIGTGSARYAVEAASKAMTETIASFLSDLDGSMLVQIYLQGRGSSDEGAYLSFFESFGRLKGANPKESDSSLNEALQTGHRGPLPLLILEKERVSLENQLWESSDRATSGANVILEERLMNNAAERAAASKVTGVRSESGPVKVFISYAHADESFCHDLRIALGTLKQQNLVEAWSDKQLVPGERWNETIRRELDQASIVLFLISPDFMASEFISSVEVKRSLERHQSGVAKLIPIMIRKTYWQNNPLSAIQGLPQALKPVSTFENKDEAYFEIVSGIAEAIATLQ